MSGQAGREMGSEDLQILHRQVHEVWQHAVGARCNKGGHIRSAADSKTAQASRSCRTNSTYRVFNRDKTIRGQRQTTGG